MIILIVLLSFALSGLVQAIAHWKFKTPISDGLDWVLTFALGAGPVLAYYLI